MHGPERLGLDVFAFDNLRTVDQDLSLARPEEGHLLKIEGELIQGVTQPRNNLPRNMWDRQRQGGTLSDGRTRVWWIIHDNFMPGRPGVRLFDVIFVRQADANTNSGRRLSYNAWRESVTGQWLRYLSSGYRRFVTFMRRNNAPPRWPSSRRPEYPQARLQSRSRPQNRRSGAPFRLSAPLRPRIDQILRADHDFADMDRGVSLDSLLSSLPADLPDAYPVYPPHTHDDLVTHVGGEAARHRAAVSDLVYIEEADLYADSPTLVGGAAGYGEPNLPFFTGVSPYPQEPTNHPGDGSDFFGEPHIPIRARVPNNDPGDDTANLEGHEVAEAVYQLADRIQQLRINNGVISEDELAGALYQVTGGRNVINDNLYRDTTPEQ